jgi:serine/threonine protein phosphatase PrpC
MVRFTQVGDSTAWLRRVQSGKSGVWKDEVRGQTVRQGQGWMVYACLGHPHGRSCPDPTVTSFPASSGDIVVVHTDGVDPVFAEDQWRDRLAPQFGRISLDEIALQMTTSAAELGSTDNATVLVFVVP